MKLTKEIKLAITAIIALGILIWGINFLKSNDLFNRNYNFYGIYDRVDGLKISNSVVYRGYTIGQVDKITFIGERYDRVLVQFSVSKEIRVPANCIARIESADFMGSKVIDLIDGTTTEFAKNNDTLRTSVELGLMEQVNEQIKPLKMKAENIMMSIDSAISVLQKILNGDTQHNIENSFKSITHTLSRLENASGSLDNFITNESKQMSDILGQVNVVTSTLKQSNGAISRSLQNIADLSDTLKNAQLGNTIHKTRKVLFQIDSITEKVNRGKGSVSEFLNKDEFYYNFTTLSSNLNNLLSDFQDNPKRYISFSLMDFTGNKKDENFGIVIHHATKPILPSDSLYIQNSKLKEVRKSGEFLYIVETTKNLQQAERKLKKIQEEHKGAYIVNLR